MLTDTGLELSRPETFGIPRALRPAAETPRALGKVRHDVRNELLGALDEHDVATILPRLERLHLKPRQVLLERNLPAAHAYFIESGAASMLSRVGDRSWVEVATLGRQDFVGLPIMLGTGRSPHRCVVQVAGEALRIGAEELQKAMDELPALRRVLLAYVQSRMVQGAQLVACNTRHSLAERLARWLLSAHDRLEGDVIPLTHQCLGRSLGVRRAGITTAVGRMEKAGLIRRGRGQLLIVDREGLERTSCECYRAIRAECQRVTRPGFCGDADAPKLATRRAGAGEAATLSGEPAGRA